MQDETAEAVIDLTTVYGEIFPHANPENARFTGEHITMVALFRREMKLLEERMARHDPKDAE